MNECYYTQDDWLYLCGIPLLDFQHNCPSLICKETERENISNLMEMFDLENGKELTDYLFCLVDALVKLSNHRLLFIIEREKKRASNLTCNTLDIDHIEISQ
jgi:hypothetical protein